MMEDDIINNFQKLMNEKAVLTYDYYELRFLYNKPYFINPIN